MSTQNPNDNAPQDNDLPESEVDQSDALKRAMLKLKESGMLTHVPDDLENIVSEAQSVTESSTEKQPASIDSLSQLEPDPTPDAQTIANRSQLSAPTIASTDDVEKHSEERTKWAAVMSGWDEVNAEADSAPPTIPSRPTPEKEIKAENLDSPATDSWELPESTNDSDEPESTPSVDEQAAITLRRKEIKPAPRKNETALTDSREQTPWTLQQFFDGEIDLEQELIKRFPQVPAMTTVKFRTLGMNSSRKVATLAAQDGSSQIIIDADVSTKVIQISFTYGSMMTLRYVLSDIPPTNRERWLDLMRREKGGLAFLWNEDRWREDYLVCVSREYATNIFAFSPRNFESAVRITKTVTDDLLDWLEEVWNTAPEPDEDDDSPLLTW